MFGRKLFCLFFIPVFMMTPVVLSSGQQDDSTLVKLIAEYKEKTHDKVTASGNVEIHYKDIKLFADWVELNIQTKDVTARGNVSIHMPGEVIRVEEIDINLDTTKGELEEAYGMVKPTLTYEAQKVKRESGEFYRLKKAWMTTCTQEVPRWKFSCSKANFKKDDYIEMWNSVFSLKKIPVLYLPYMRYPIKDRATGFLMPRLGYSGNKGMIFDQAFYWAMKRNMDATANFNYYSAIGFGGGLQYRYIFSDDIHGNMDLFYFNFADTEYLETEEKSAYIVRMEHNQSLPFGFNLVSDIDYQSSFDFLREFDNNFMRAVVANRRSEVYLTKSWSHFNFNARAARFETYYRARDRTLIKHSFPSLSFSSSKIELFSPVFFSFSSKFERWERGWDYQFEQDAQKSNQYLLLLPRISIPFNEIPWLTINTDLLSNFSYYFKSLSEETQEVINEPVLTRNYSIDIEFTGPVFNRIFFDSNKKPKLKHIIEPTFTYRYESPVRNSERIITSTAFFIYHYFRYGLINRFLIKENDMPREILSLGLNQTFYLNSEDGPLSRYRVNGEIPEFSDISGTLRFYPTRKYSLDASASFNPYYTSLSSIRAGANLGVPSDNWFLRINWYKSVNPYRESSLINRHQVSFFGGGKIPKLSLEANAEVDYNIREKKLLYSAFSLIYHYQCLNFGADLRIFYFRDKPEIQFGFSLELGGIGKTEDFLGGFGF
ncbi:MAG: LPS-assembly protein LptD [Acidobacteriota bacterium]